MAAKNNNNESAATAEARVLDQELDQILTLLLHLKIIDNDDAFICDDDNISPPTPSAVATATQRQQQQQRQR